MPAKRPTSSASAPSAAPKAPAASQRERLAAAVRRRHKQVAAMAARLRQQELRLQELTEALRHGDRHKAEFLATMSHELRTPLNVVLGFASLIYDEAFGPLNPQQLEATGKVLESAERLTQLINDLLDTAKLDKGTLIFHVDDVNVAKLAAEVVSYMKPLADAKPVTLQLDIPAGLPHVSADAMRLQQVLNHLVDNAVKFTPAGGTITVRAYADPQLGVVVIEVVDTGIGIPADALHKLFDRFYQVDSSSTREYGGTGLGLAIVKEFVERLGGQVGVESEVGRGSTFRLVLPRSAGPAN